MATLQQATHYDMTGYGERQIPDANRTTPPPQQSYPEQPNRFLRATVPQIANASADSQRSYFNGGAVPQTRIPILNALGSPF